MKLNIADNLTIDLLRLVDSRALIQGNSGGGKSWLLRLIAEQSAGYVQTIILDPEGEFATLREKHDFLLVGSGGEIPCEVRSASLLARKLLELRASAVIDLYELKLHERRRFVRLFLEALMSLPKTSWHPTLIMLDEAHLFCPERSAGESESTQAVIDLMSQGRKRSYAGILATQRLSKLHKDAEAETNNVFIGRSWLDVDQKRAGALLGMDGNARQQLRDLEPGEFMAFGPALSVNGISRFRSAAVQTSHPKAGQRHRLTPPKPSEAVRRIVADLADLPQQADAEVKNFDDAKKRITELERALKARPKDTQIKIQEKRVEVPVLKNGQLERVEKIIDRADKLGHRIAQEAKDLRIAVMPAMQPVKNDTRIIPKIIPTANTSRQNAPSQPARPQPQRERVSVVSIPFEGTLPIGERKVLSALIQYPAGLYRQQLTVLTGYKRSSRDAYLQRLREKGFVSTDGDRCLATDVGVAALPDAEPLPTGEALQAYWLVRLPIGERAILERLIDRRGEPIPRDELSEVTGYQRSSRDAYLQRLSAKELVENVGRGEVRAVAQLFEG